jgi:hypothetical protein
VASVEPTVPEPAARVRWPHEPGGGLGGAAAGARLSRRLVGMILFDAMIIAVIFGWNRLVP